MSTMMEILKKVEGLFVGPVSSGTDKQNEILTQELPFKILNYQSGREHNGWYVPQKWEVIKAEIRKDGQLIYDGRQHPLGVIGYSQPFSGRVPLTELKEHLCYHEHAPADTVYHCDLYYKPHRKLWGFSVPYNLYKNLKDGEYQIDLQTTFTDDTMKVLEYTHQGESEDTIVFNAHNCHAAQLNDGPAGYVVFIEALKRLMSRKTRFTYKLIIAPEHLGTVFYLAELSEKEIKKIKYGIFCEIVGHDNPRFALQQSFTGQSLIDKIAHHVLKFNSRGYWSDGFRKIVGNDESVWEAPGCEVPMISLTRAESNVFFYQQYHSNSDNLSIINENNLEETVKVILAMVDILEKNCYLKRTFQGLIALSNPRYDLYIARGNDPSLKLDDDIKYRHKWFNSLDHILRYFDENWTILDIAIKHDLPFCEVYDYLCKFKEKDLIEFINK